MERLEKLREMLARQAGDPFLLYALGMEYKKLGRLEEAVAQFDAVVTVDPGYCYAYYQKGQALEGLGRADAAREAYGQGVSAAERKGDGHARQELAAAREALG